MSNSQILLIEDEAADILLTQRAIKKAGIPAEVTILSDGLDALNYLFESDDDKELPTLVLLDLHLPRVYGLHILKRIRETPATRLIPVVVLTSSELIDDRMSSIELGADSYVSKPITPTKLVNVIKKLRIAVLAPRDGQRE